MAKNEVPEQDKTPFSRDAKLLIMGSIISFVSFLATTYFTNSREDEKELRFKKYTVIEQVSKDIGQRLLITEEFHRAQHPIDNPPLDPIKIKAHLDTVKKKYKALQERWNGVDFMYEVQLNKFFGDTNFIKTIYNPMVYLGKYCEYGDTTHGVTEKTFVFKYIQAEKITHVFVHDLYLGIK
jgi:hypothetical protein